MGELTTDTTREPVTLAGRYRLGERLGRGATAEVWRGFDERLRRNVAVKLLDPVMAVEPGVRERFESEARAAAGLCHPNIVSVFDSGEHDGLPFLVMELLGGRTLADEMACGPLPEARVRGLGLEILDALDCSHRAGIVHRDVKPANILFTGEGSAKIADFGIARSTGSHSVTDTGTVIGTANYMAPERAAGQPANAGSDIYAVGILMYEALAGHKPFSANTPIGIIRAALSGEVTRLEVLRPGIDPSLAAAVQRAMAPDPETRHSSAVAMASALSVPGTVNATRLRTADDTIVTRVAAGDATPGPLSALPAFAAVASTGTGDATAVSALASTVPTAKPAARSVLRDRTLLLISAAAAVTLGLVLWAGGGDTPSPAVGGVESPEQVAEPIPSIAPSTTFPPARVVAPPPEADAAEVDAADAEGSEVEDRGARRQRERAERLLEREQEQAFADANG